MTTTDKPVFAQVFARLAIALREPAPDVVTLRVYFEGLQACELEFVTAAAERLARAFWFPKVGQWLHAAETIERERVTAQRAFLRNLPAPLCAVCQDTGWAMEDGRAARCACAAHRRLELLGRVPLQALPTAPTDDPLPAAPTDDSSTATDHAEARRLLGQIATRTGRPIVQRHMPEGSPHRTDTEHRAREQQLRDQARQIGSRLS